MKFEDKDRIIYVKDDSYDKKNDRSANFILDGNNNYYRGYLIHKEIGPAVIWNDGYKSYFKNGKHHREDGPAIEWYDIYKQYYLNGIIYSEEKYWKIINLKKKQEILDNVL